MISREWVKRLYDQAQERIAGFHLRTLDEEHGQVFLISTQYPGVWLEHAFDALAYYQLVKTGMAKEVLRNQMLIFLDHQLPDGRLPFNVMDRKLSKSWTGMRPVNYNQIQECVSFGTLCLETCRILNDRDFLIKAYDKLCLWDEWLCKNRRTLGTELIELFCLFDTGHDNSARLEDIPVQCPDMEGKIPVDALAIPMLAPDMNAVFYGDRCALREMAILLGRNEEARTWDAKACRVAETMMSLLYDPADQFFYDRDRNGRMRKFLSISISNVFTEHVLPQELFDKIYDRHLRNPAEFWTPYPFPSLALSDPRAAHHTPANCWGYFSMALTGLRGMLWMDHYNRGADYDYILSKWLSAFARQPERCFSQEMDPVTGRLTECSPYYSTAMLLFMYAAKRLGYM